jgi:hypothetical protein
MGTTTPNPLLQPWTAPFGLPPFAQIKAEHFAPALTAVMAEHREELARIASQDEPANFDNTIAWLDRSGRNFTRVSAVFHNLCASETSPALQKVQREMAEPMAAHSNALYMNAGLFARIDTLHRDQLALGLTSEQARLLNQIHKDFVRAGAKLQGGDRERYAHVTERPLSARTCWPTKPVSGSSSRATRISRGCLFFCVMRRHKPRLSGASRAMSSRCRARWWCHFSPSASGVTCAKRLGARGPAVASMLASATTAR